VSSARIPASRHEKVATLRMRLRHQRQGRLDPQFVALGHAAHAEGDLRAAARLALSVPGRELNRAWAPRDSRSAQTTLATLRDIHSSVPKCLFS
jgi:hypothetical protein